MLKIFKYFKWYDWLTVLAVGGLVTLQVWLELKMPEYMQQITNNITSNPDFTMKQIWASGGWMLACAAGSLAGAILTTFLVTRMAAEFGARLRSELFTKVESFSAAEINRFSTPSLITRTTNDVTQVQMLVGMGTNLLLRAPIMAIWAITKISAKSWQFMAITGAAVGLLLVLVIFIVLVALPKFRKIQTQTDTINRLTRENLTGIRVVRAYNAEGYQEERFEKANEDMTKTQLFANRAMQVMMPGMMLILSGLTLGINLIGAVLINQAGLTDMTTFVVDGAEQIMPVRAALFSEMFTFSMYAMQVIMAFIMLVMIFIVMPRAVVAAKRILEVLTTEPSIKDGAGVQPLAGDAGKVEFKNVSFKYPDAEKHILENISFTVNKGETIAFIGSTGSGKSTLINLVPRFYDATEGEVSVDGVNVKDYKIDELNNRLGYISQKGVLFSDSVRGNVDYGDSGKEVSEEDIALALQTAQAQDFVSGLEDGLESHIAQGGTNLSGGQKQRLSIARAIAKKPEILIFDDSFSALDYRTDKALRAALKKELAGTTNLIVAQRIGTIRDADKIMVLDEGKAVGCGTHDELMKNCPVYIEIAHSQLSKEELENGRS